MVKINQDTSRERGLALQFACRTDKKLCEAVLEIPAAEVECADGLKNVLNKLDKFHTVNKKDKAVRSYKEFLALKRRSNQKMDMWYCGHCGSGTGRPHR